MVVLPSIRWSGRASIVGGIVWVVYSTFEMLRPFGIASTYDPSLGYDRIMDGTIYRLYLGVGNISVVLLSVAVLGLSRLGRTGGLLRGGRVVGAVSFVMGLVGLVGVVLLAPIPAGLGAMLGSIILAVGTALAVGGIWLHSDIQPTTAMIALAAAGLLIVPLRTLVNALQLLPASVAVTIMIIWGVCWIITGVQLMRRVVYPL